MKPQGLTEPMKGGIAKHASLRSELAKKEKLVEELRKENEVNICKYLCLCAYTYVETCNPCLLICSK